MTKPWAPWLMMLFLALQFIAVATDAHQFNPSHGEPQVIAFLEDGVGTQASDVESSDNLPSSHDHCPHCCHCHWHVVTSIPVLGSLRLNAVIPSYHSGDWRDYLLHAADTGRSARALQSFAQGQANTANAQPDPQCEMSFEESRTLPEILAGEILLPFAR